MQYNRNLYVFYLFEAVKRQKKFLKFTEKTPHTSVAYILDTWRDSDYFFHDISLCNCCFFRTTFTLLLQCKGYSQRKSIEMRHFFEKNCSLVLPCSGDVRGGSEDRPIPLKFWNLQRKSYKLGIPIPLGKKASILIPLCEIPNVASA